MRGRKRKPLVNKLSDATVNGLLRALPRPETCGGCGMACRTTMLGGLYIPAGSARAIPYVLCDGCAKRLTDGESKADVLLAVELRIGPMRGTA